MNLNEYMTPAGAVDWLTVVATILGFAWSFFKASDWWKEHVSTQRQKAVDAIEAAVEEVYRGYVRERKEKSATGELTSEEKNVALEMAKGLAENKATVSGVNLKKQLGTQLLNLFIARAGDARKKAGDAAPPT